MCEFFLALSPLQPTVLSTVAAVAQALRHRGPDDEGYAQSGCDAPGKALLRRQGSAKSQGVRDMHGPPRPEAEWRQQARCGNRLLMAHLRLAIVDFSPHGHQPMRRGDDLHVVFTGEIYNHVESRARLQAVGQDINSHSDSEVPPAAYTQRGPQALKRLSGMWGIEVHDTCLYAKEDPRIARLARQMRSRGHGVALHAAIYASADDAVVLRPEFAPLQPVAGGNGRDDEPWANRQHFLRRPRAGHPSGTCGPVRLSLRHQQRLPAVRLAGRARTGRA